ncbi:hypothetical protein IWQ62_004736 [Dispira parvispora]|uniref:MARVEL domain-containing protein n=1 Tax=Dispira parvispora TaxID=1520584 RepID=A0A9W8E1P8_9FUNG|nr:hypothetical protein IWQ62_004736 [Dispira parvispora]
MDPRYPMSMPNAGGTDSGTSAYPHPANPPAQGMAAPTVADSPYGASNFVASPAPPLPPHSATDSANVSGFNLPPGVIPVSVPHSSMTSPDPHSATLPTLDSSVATPPPPPPPGVPEAMMTSFDDKPENDVPLYDKYARMTTPDKRKEVVRLIQVLASVGALAFPAAANAYSDRSNPFSDKSPTNYLYFVSGLSIVVSLFFFLSFFWRFKRLWSQKQRCWGLFIADFMMVLFWLSSVAVLLAKNTCAVGTHNGWCDFYNIGIFFGFLALVCFLITTIWNVIAFLKSRRG